MRECGFKYLWTFKRGSQEFLHPLTSIGLKRIKRSLLKPPQKHKFKQSKLTAPKVVLSPISYGEAGLTVVFLSVTYLKSMAPKMTECQTWWMDLPRPFPFHSRRRQSRRRCRPRRRHRADTDASATAATVARSGAGSSGTRPGTPSGSWRPNWSPDLVSSGCQPKTSYWLIFTPSLAFNYLKNGWLSNFSAKQVSQVFLRIASVWGRIVGWKSVY